LAEDLEIPHEPHGRGGARHCFRAGRRLGDHRHRVVASQDRVPRSFRSQVARRLAAPFLGLLFVATLLAGGCAYWTEKQGELIFRPTKDAWWGFNGAAIAFEERWIPVGAEGQKLNAWWLKAENPKAPSILYLHGARWNLTGSVSRLERWRKLGFNVLAIDYRGFGKSADAAPSEESANEDAEAAWAYLAQIAPQQPRYVVGHSLGGVIAVELASRHPDASGLVLEATFTSVRDMVAHSPWSFLPVGLVLTQEFDALAKIPEVHVPVLVVHGTRDAVVPFEMGEKLYAAAPGPKRFIKVEGGSHHNLSYVAFDEYRAALAQLFKIGS
jgi:pimeloyl-ACP methyl ester carboxylesterase